MVKAEHLGGDRWRVRVYVGRDATTGKPRQVSRTFRANGARPADKQRRKIEAELARDANLARDRRATINGVIDDWLQLPRATSTTYRNESIIRAIRYRFGATTLENLNTRDIDLWYAALLAEGRSASTVNHYHRVLSSILRQAELWGRLEFAPTRKARPPKKPRPNPRPPADDVLATLIADASPSVQMGALLAARLGVRLGELCGLRWSDIDMTRRIIHVERAISYVPGRPLEVKAPKSEASIRDIDIDDATIAALTLWREAHPGPPDGYILADPFDPSLPRRPDWLSLAWRRLCKQHGVKVRFHDIRHWSVTQLLASGVAITTVSRRHGHSLTSTTVNMYGGERAGAGAEAARVLGELLPSPLTPVAVPETKPLVDGIAILPVEPRK